MRDCKFLKANTSQTDKVLDHSILGLCRVGSLHEPRKRSFYLKSQTASLEQTYPVRTPPAMKTSCEGKDYERSRPECENLYHIHCSHIERASNAGGQVRAIYIWICRRGPHPVFLVNSGSRFLESVGGVRSAG